MDVLFSPELLLLLLPSFDTNVMYSFPLQIFESSLREAARIIDLIAELVFYSTVSVHKLRWCITFYSKSNSRYSFLVCCSEYE